MVKERNVALSAIFTVITFGIYGIYWFVCMTDEALGLSEEKGAGGILAFIFNLITFGLYGWYWAYKMGDRLETAKRKRNIEDGSANNGVLYLILNIIGLSLVTYILIQIELNKFSAKRLTH
ncbi:DUF4234 domain-containing protein [Aminipila luticellarii]|uniref:DUF4234 domain-containing protein n=1 Tax=Aminipila luticellarii TaxID=2507160 RepID=A0A410PVS2_9FIRM|nr:DUF4234 domain-containing protein [Aminipila luticellarii]QAT43027.1 DUF4234 domain-containing protein [Aminipila luticellarii]